MYIVSKRNIEKYHGKKSKTPNTRMRIDSSIISIKMRREIYFFVPIMPLQHYEPLKEAKSRCKTSNVYVI